MESKSEVCETELLSGAKNSGPLEFCDAQMLEVSQKRAITFMRACLPVREQTHDLTEISVGGAKDRGNRRIEVLRLIAGDASYALTLARAPAFH